MTYKGHASARGNDAPFSSFEEQFDRTPDISASERTTLTLLHQTFETSSKVWLPGASKQIERLTTPLRVTLDWLCTPESTQFAIVHVLLREMHRRGRAVWGWSSDEWVETLCAHFRSFGARHCPGGNCRQHVLSPAYLFCGFDPLAQIGRFLPYHPPLQLCRLTAGC